MVITGSNVVSLYQNLEISKDIKEAVLEYNIQWEEIDYQEAVRYLALNWDADTCSRSVLPVRRGKRGTRPGMKGSGNPEGLGEEGDLV